MILVIVYECIGILVALEFDMQPVQVPVRRQLRLPVGRIFGVKFMLIVAEQACIDTLARIFVPVWLVLCVDERVAWAKATASIKAGDLDM